MKKLINKPAKLDSTIHLIFIFAFMALLFMTLTGCATTGTQDGTDYAGIAAIFRASAASQPAVDPNQFMGSGKPRTHCVALTSGNVTTMDCQ